MKRLIKKSALNNCRKAVSFINALKKTANEKNENLIPVMKAICELTDINDDRPLRALYEDILSSDPDCVYNGTVYRKLSLDKEEIIPKLDQYYSDEDIESDDNMYDTLDVVREIRAIIKTGTFQSSTYDLQACRDFYQEIYDSPLDVIISFECKNGIDVMKLARKYLGIAKDYINTNAEYKEYFNYLRDMVKEFECEKEVYCMVPNDYEVYSIDDEVVKETDTIELEI